jgi:hypothetical protein
MREQRECKPRTRARRHKAASRPAAIIICCLTFHAVCLHAAKSLRHAAIPLQSVLAHLLVHLDGSHNSQMLTAKLIKALRGGEVRIAELQSDQLSAESSQLQLIAEQYVERTLSYCALHALLEPTTA